MGIENPVHLIFIGVVALLVLGPKRLPELARALGHGIREFREAMEAHDEEPVAHHFPAGPAEMPDVSAAAAPEEQAQQAHPAAHPLERDGSEVANGQAD